MTARRKLLLFDIDGTLLLGSGAGARAMLRAGRAVCGEAFTLDGVLISGGLDPIIFAEASALMGLFPAAELHAAFHDRYLEELSAEIRTVKPGLRALPGARELLLTLREREDVALGLVTGNYVRAVPLKLDAVNMSHAWFPHGAFGDEGPTRPSLVALALQRYRALTGHAIEPSDALVIGDTPRDVDCAHKNGVPCVAVATGMYSRDQLAAAGPERVLTDLSDPAGILDLL